MTTATMPPPEAPPKPPEPGWYEDMPMASYLALDLMSASGMETFRRSPLHYRYERDHPDEESTRALGMGTALHLALLEPDLFETTILRSGECGKPLSSGKRKGEPCGCTATVHDERYGWLCGKHTDREPTPGAIPPEDYDAVTRMRDEVLAHPRARTFFEGQVLMETTGVWEDPETGVLCKIRPDLRVQRAPVLPDLKSTRDASYHAFRVDAARRGYHRKLAFYRRGVHALDGEWLDPTIIAVENTEPHAVAVYLLDDDDLRAAEREVSHLLNRFKWCQEEDHWPGYGDEFSYLKMPAWATSGDYNDE